MFLFLTIANVLELYFSIENAEVLYKFLINFGLQVVFAIYFYFLIKTYQKKFLFFKFSHGDYVLFSIFVFILSLGLFSFSYGLVFVELVLLFLPLVVMAKILPIDKYFIFASIFASGGFFVSGQHIYLIFASVLAIFLMEIKTTKKWLYSICSVAIITGLIFVAGMWSVINVIFALMPSVVIIAVPSKVFNYFEQLFAADSVSMIFKHLESQRVGGIKNRLELMADTLLCMHRDFKFLLVGKIDKEAASRELAGDVITRCCTNCENFKTCFFGNINKREMFENLMSKALQTKSINDFDVTNGMQAYCTKSSIVVSEINQIAVQFEKFESAMKNEDASKLLISDELKNFSDIFNNFSKTIDSRLLVNDKLSFQTKERLISNLLDAKEVVILENKFGIESVNVIAPNEQVLKREMLEGISRSVKNEMKLSKVWHTEISGLSLAEFIPMSKFRVQFAVSTKAKENKNGDNVTITKISSSKYFVALADGMGHGEKANRISVMVLSLIRSMFEVGFDENLIITSINKLLIPAGLDNFTTLDAALVDTDKGECKFVKLGSSVSVLKRKQVSELIVSKSLPIGIVQNITPTITKKVIQAGDTVFLASDGVVDSFSSVEAYKTFINDAKIFNMQKFLDDVIADADNMSKHPDDMTIIAINLLKN